MKTTVKTMLKTPMILALGVVLPALIAMSWQARADEFNPYEQGTQTVVIPAEERALLAQYADNSKVQIEKALNEGKDVAHESAIFLYTRVIKSVVRESFQSKPRTELLMRYALNQALELTIGTPTADGMSIAKEGVLKDAANPDLVRQILEDSLRLALHYYQDDRKAIDQQTLINLPYAALAYDRMVLARYTWLPAVAGTPVAYEFSRTVLKQFHTTIAHEESQRKILFAEEIDLAEGVLAREQSPVTGVSDILKHVRMLRRELRELTEKMAPKIKSYRVMVTEVASATKIADPVQKAADEENRKKRDEENRKKQASAANAGDVYWTDSYNYNYVGTIKRAFQNGTIEVQPKQRDSSDYSPSPIYLQADDVSPLVSSAGAKGTIVSLGDRVHFRDSYNYDYVATVERIFKNGRVQIHTTHRDANAYDIRMFVDASDLGVAVEGPIPVHTTVMTTSGSYTYVGTLSIHFSDGWDKIHTDTRDGSSYSTELFVHSSQINRELK